MERGSEAVRRDIEPVWNVGRGMYSGSFKTFTEFVLGSSQLADVGVQRPLRSTLPILPYLKGQTVEPDDNARARLGSAHQEYRSTAKHLGLQTCQVKPSKRGDDVIVSLLVQDRLSNGKNPRLIVQHELPAVSKAFNNKLPILLRPLGIPPEYEVDLTEYPAETTDFRWLEKVCVDLSHVVSRDPQLAKVLFEPVNFIPAAIQAPQPS